MPTVLEHQGSLGEVVLGKGTPYLVDSWQYLDMPQQRTADYFVPGQHGRNMAPADTYDGRNVGVKLVVFGADTEVAMPRTVEDYRANDNALVAAIAAWGDLPIYQILRLHVVGDSFVSRWVGRVRNSKGDDSMADKGYGIRDIMFESIRSWRERDDASTLTINQGGNANAVSNGTIPVYPVFTITAGGGGCTNPSIEDTTHSLALVFDDLALDPGEVLTVNVLDATAIASGVSVYSSLVQDDWFTIPPGTTNIGFSVDTGTATLGVSWRDGYM